jgi:hypothetical protein
MPKHAKVDRICNASLQACSAVGTHLRVNQERKGQVLFASEIGCVFRSSVAHDYQFGAQITYFRLHVAQLRNLLAAEQSPEVPYEYKNNRFLLSITPKRNGAAFRIKNLYRRKPGCYTHLPILLLSATFYLGGTADAS